MQQLEISASYAARVIMYDRHFSGQVMMGQAELLTASVPGMSTIHAPMQRVSPRRFFVHTFLTHNPYQGYNSTPSMSIDLEAEAVFSLVRPHTPALPHRLRTVVPAWPT